MTKRVTLQDFQQGSGMTAQGAAAILGNSGPHRLGTTESTNSDNAPKSVSPFAEMAKRAAAAAQNIQNDAQAVINQAAAGLVEEKAVEAAETPAQVTQVSPAPQVDSAPIAPSPEGKIEAEEIPLNDRLKIFDGRNDEGAFHRMIDLSQRLLVAKIWDGKGELWFHDPYTIHQRVALGDISLYGLERWRANEGLEYHIALPAKKGSVPAEVIQPAPITPTVVAPAPAGPREFVINTLLSAPAKIFDSQKTFDDADRLYKARLAELSIKALSAQMFPGKKDGDPNRTAGNDVERELAIQQLVATDMTLINFAASREAALRELMRDRNTFEAAKIAAQLLSNQAA